MVSPVYVVMKVMICFVLFCTLISFGQTQPVFNNDEDDQMQVYDDIYASHIPRNFYDYHPSRGFFQLNNQRDHPDGLQLAKRIIMLPRVGRRSVRSTSES